ncbi:hypothetical protein QJS04_geneDACA010451 [Acorus gramineus]|uniref:Neprosin PEP catalytic domain-containing protein n=1 Tax=Acorus gramineus TaxID=55184 RepID=A0AAV9AM10_ACOGR|nr:hypothetical protein QJS04_geneDACA010451 [Acorus gramineus]
MGSGHFSGEGLGRASYIGNIMVVDNDDSQTIEIPDQISVFNTKPECYDLSLGQTTDNGMLFFFGGPGFNENCR